MLISSKIPMNILGTSNEIFLLLDKMKLLKCFRHNSEIKKMTKELVTGDSTLYVECVICVFPSENTDLVADI